MYKATMGLVITISFFALDASEVPAPSSVPSLKTLCFSVVKREYAHKGHLLKKYQQALQDIVGLDKDYRTRAEWIEILNFIRSPELDQEIEIIAQKQLFEKREAKSQMPVEAGHVLAWVKHIKELQKLPEPVSSKIWTKRNQR